MWEAKQATGRNSLLGAHNCKNSIPWRSSTDGKVLAVKGGRRGQVEDDKVASPHIKTLF